MNEISKKLSKFIDKQQKKLISSGVVMPVKVPGGILVGPVKIIQEGTVKHLYYYEDLIYSNISLNSVAIYMANFIATKKNSVGLDSLYKADQEYSKWYNDCEILMNSRRLAINSNDHDRADMLLARYQESKLRAASAKKLVERLMQK